MRTIASRPHPSTGGNWAASGRHPRTAGAGRVLGCIALHADASGRAYPSMVTIAAMTGIRRSDVPRSIRRIERLGLLQTARHGPRGTNLYTVVFHPSASLRTVRTAADGGCPQECEPGVRTDAAKVSAIPRTKQPDEQTPARRAAPERVHVIDSASEFELFWRVYPSGTRIRTRKSRRGKRLKRQLDAASIRP
ncbi:MAG: helix-turn-helix domain-containing protein [Stellaceae bacterium]